MPNIRLLCLESNPIKSLVDIRGIQHVPSGVTITVTDVHLDCELDMCWAADITSYDIQLSIFSCGTPESMKNKILADMTEEDLCSSKKLGTNLKLPSLFQK